MLRRLEGPQLVQNPQSHPNRTLHLPPTRPTRTSPLLHQPPSYLPNVLPPIAVVHDIAMREQAGAEEGSNQGVVLGRILKHKFHVVGVQVPPLELRGLAGEIVPNEKYHLRIPQNFL